MNVYEAEGTPCRKRSQHIESIGLSHGVKEREVSHARMFWAKGTADGDPECAWYALELKGGQCICSG